MPTVDVPTARGDAIPSSELGITLMHEHVFLCDAEVNTNWPETFGDVEERIADATAQLRAAHEAGIRTITDVSVIGHGRNIARVAEVARRTDLNIIVATGVYALTELPSFFRLFGPGALVEAPETMTDYFVRDIEEGIGDTGVRAAILKVATAHAGLTTDVERGLRAIAQAHRRTGVPITTHTSLQQNGLDQQRVFEEEGVDLSRVVIGHTDVTAGGDVGYVEEILSKGSFVGFDSFGMPIVDDETRISLLVDVLKRGHGEKIVISHDHACFADFMRPDFMGETYRKTYFPEVVVPELHRRGVTDDEIGMLTVANPRRVFETAAAGGY